MAIAQVEHKLPQLMTFTRKLAQDTQGGMLNDWPTFSHQVQTFFSESTLAETDAVIPGWRTMAEQGDGQILVHVISVLVSLILCPEYQSATPKQKALAEWIVLFHDVSKRHIDGKRDCPHAFRSAAMTGPALPNLSFPLFKQDTAALDRWAHLTMTATTLHPALNIEIQDNDKLPEIIAGIDDLFGERTPAALVIKAVLLHMAINVVTDWPQVAPLNDQEIQRYLDTDLLPLLKIMMLVDNDAWGFFHYETKTRHRQETLAVFERIQRLIS